MKDSSVNTSFSTALPKEEVNLVLKAALDESLTHLARKLGLLYIAGNAGSGLILTDSDGIDYDIAGVIVSKRFEPIFLIEYSLIPSNHTGFAERAYSTYISLKHKFP